MFTGRYELKSYIKFQLILTTVCMWNVLRQTTSKIIFLDFPPSSRRRLGGFPKFKAAPAALPTEINQNQLPFFADKLVFQIIFFSIEQTAIISLYSINLSVFITEAESIFYEVRNGSLNQAYSFVLKGLTFNNCTFAHTVFMCFVFIWEQTATCATYSINWLVFITQMKSAYCAVRTVSLNKAVCALSLKG